MLLIQISGQYSRFEQTREKHRIFKAKGSRKSLHEGFIKPRIHIALFLVNSVWYEKFSLESHMMLLHM